MARLARAYRFRNIGGASAGAIAAAGAAAAEYGRSRNPAAFDGIASIPDWAQGTAKSGKTNLELLFQPRDATRLLFDLALALSSGDRGAAIRLALTKKPLWTAAFAAPLGVLWLPRLLKDVQAVLEDNYWGMCSGLTTSYGEGADALTPWLADLIDNLAGRDTSGRPLTFGDLWHGQTVGEGLARERAGGPRVINLAMVTTAITLGRPFYLPFGSPLFYWRPADFRRLFPKRVVEWMQARAERMLSHMSPAAHERRGAYAPEFLPWLRPHELPIVVAARMSLSFPFLISAIPLYAINFGWMKNVELHRRSGKPELERVWFSDGGFTSNFPVHLFDGPLPDRPTFFVDLADPPPDRPRPSKVPAENVWMPERNNEGRRESWSRPGRKNPLADIAMMMFDSSRNWLDNTQMRSPGFRDRVVHVLQWPDEGGLKLSMPPGVIQALADRGDAAAELLLQHYPPDGQGAGEINWSNHRWIRLRTLISVLARTGSDFATAYTGPADWSGFIESGHASYRLRDAPVSLQAIAGFLAFGQATAPAGGPLTKNAPQPQPRFWQRPWF